MKRTPGEGNHTLALTARSAPVAHWLLVAVLVVASALLTGACSPSSTPNLPRALVRSRHERSPFGINYPWWARLDADARRTMIARIDEAGLRWVRVYLPWGHIEQRQGVFDWGDYGRFVDDAASAGLAVEAVLVHPTPCWASESCTSCRERDNNCRPSNAAYFQNFAFAAARRFGTRVAAWALWQEPNAPDQWDGTDRREAAAAYQRLILVPGYRGLTAAQPDARVTAPGVVSWDECSSHAVESRDVTPLVDPWIVSEGTRLAVPLAAITIHRYGTSSEINRGMDCLTRRYRSRTPSGAERPLCHEGQCPPFWLEEFATSGDACALGEGPMQTAINVWDHANAAFPVRLYWHMQGVPAECSDTILFHNDLQPIDNNYCLLSHYVRRRRGLTVEGECPPSRLVTCGAQQCGRRQFCSAAGACVCGLAPGQGLSAGQSVQSCDGRFTLVMQADGNLVLGWAVGPGGVLWHASTHGHPNSFVNMQADGNLVAGSVAAGVTWTSDTHGHPGAFLVVQNDGNLVVYSPRWEPLWQAGTGDPSR